MVIYKYPLSKLSKQTIEVDGSIEYILKLDVQNDIPTIWMLIDKSKEKRTLSVRIVVTGEELEYEELDKMGYLDTFKSDWFVGHVFTDFI